MKWILIYVITLYPADPSSMRPVTDHIEFANQVDCKNAFSALKDQFQRPAYITRGVCVEAVR